MFTTPRAQGAMRMSGNCPNFSSVVFHQKDRSNIFMVLDGVPVRKFSSAWSFVQPGPECKADGILSCSQADDILQQIICKRL
ncbi:hypothetical protein Q7C36_020423 [Tachysurus vachellii]|uniref:Uncharacterized protein n=1 Tax=Tachysurus vachellii TaxID=175792 RepID=A0AA88LUR7_TACVA|nr:hypothetical protein Q7C36_020423 [Tachysurus vachellii]